MSNPVCASRSINLKKNSADIIHVSVVLCQFITLLFMGNRDNTASQKLTEEDIQHGTDNQWDEVLGTASAFANLLVIFFISKR